MTGIPRRSQCPAIPSGLLRSSQAPTAPRQLSPKLPWIRPRALLRFPQSLPWARPSSRTCSCHGSSPTRTWNHPRTSLRTHPLIPQWFPRSQPPPRVLQSFLKLYCVLFLTTTLDLRCVAPQGSICLRCVDLVVASGGLSVVLGL